MFFLSVLKNKDEDCVDAAIISDALPQVTEAFEREFKPKMFCCSFPQNPFMCDNEERIGTFPKRWFNQKRSTSREMVDAGFNCISSDDRVRCFYCGARLL